MTEIQFHQYKQKCKDASFLMDNKNALNRVISSLTSEASSKPDDYLDNKQITLNYCGYSLVVTGKDLLALLEKTRDDCETKFSELKICECEECKA